MVDIDIYSLPQNQHLYKLKVPQNATIKDVKIEIAKRTTKLKVERQSIRSELRGKDQKDELNISNITFENVPKLYVKDLGPQISWKGVFVLEYLGPFVVYILVATRPWLLYGDKDINKEEFSLAAKLGLICWSVHYLKRLFETLFVHRFSHGTMPFRNLFKNCGYYWGFTAYVAYHVNHPLYSPPNILFTTVGVFIFVFAELGNLSIHLLLRNLRPPGTKVRKIPMPNSNPFTQLFTFVSCPNYTYEYAAWVGFSLMTFCLPAFLFAIAGMYQMTLWALGKHKAYKAEFKNYPKRKAIIPFIL